MPQDKRLIVTKAVLYKLKRVCAEEDVVRRPTRAASLSSSSPSPSSSTAVVGVAAAATVAAHEGVYLCFLLPPVILSQHVELQDTHFFHMPHRTHVCDGSTTCLIVPRVIAADCTRINARHGYYDAVVTAEAICRRDDADALRRAARVAQTFTHFVVDRRIVGKLPMCIAEACANSCPAPRRATATATTTTAATGNKSSSHSHQANAADIIVYPRKSLTPLDGLDERACLAFTLSRGASGDVVHARRPGQLYIRVGHGDMTAGEVCENAKTFVVELKKSYPAVWRYLREFTLATNRTSSIRFMEVQLPR